MLKIDVSRPDQIGRKNLIEHLRQHHQGLGLLILELLGTRPLLPDPSRDIEVSSYN